MLLKLSVKTAAKRLPASTTVLRLPVGEVTFITSVKARNIRISLKPFGGIRVTVPKRVSVKEAMLFVVGKTDWIHKTQAKIAQMESARTVLFTPETDFHIRHLHLKLIPWKSAQFRTHTTHTEFQIFYPQDIDVLSDHAQAIIRKFITERLCKEAKEYLPQRTKQLSEKHGFAYNGVTVKLMSSRWGSCSATNHINLNIFLMRLPETLQDYVLLHELVHTMHKNHGDGFWECLNRHTGGKAKQLAAAMRHYRAVCF
ncbi:MAG: M48 family metallopeptidase [Bacteroidales bacterium]|jgi:predicted metal-dependent hydrolase|nr:M48 family metallopeptidase [Bacteroidales bacterium]